MAAVIATIVGGMITVVVEGLSLPIAAHALWRTCVYMPLPVLAVVAVTLLLQRALAWRMFVILGNFAVYVVSAIAVLLAGTVLGLGSEFLPMALLGGVLAVGVLRVLPFAARPETWLLGLILGLATTAWANLRFNLVHSIGDLPMDPNAVALLACVLLTSLTGPALAGVWLGGNSKFTRAMAALLAVAAILLAAANRAIISPRLYLEVHLALAAFEWFLWAGAISWTGFTLSRRGAIRLLVGLAIAIVVAIAINRVGEGARPAHIDYTAQMFSRSIWFMDRDGDGALPRWLGGTDCDDSDPDVHPFARERGQDENCNGLSELPQLTSPPVPPSHDVDLMFVVTIDTLRPDYMQVYGGPATTPNLAAIDDWARFDRAYTSGGITTLAVSSLLFGRLPLAIDLSPVYRTVDRRYVFPDQVTTERVNRVFHVPRAPRTPSIAQRFQGLGLRTYAFVDDGASRVFQRGLGYEAGFEVFTFPNAPEGPGEDHWNRTNVTASVIDALPSMPPGSFVWIHYYDPHNAAPPCRRFATTGQLGCYEDAIWDIDAELQQVISALHAANRWDNSFFAITSDHGEALGEHGLTHHGLDSFEEFVRIPLLARGPGITPGPVDTPVSLIDVTQTIAGYAGIVSPELQGHDLRLTQQGVPRRLPVLSQLMITSVGGVPYRQQNLLIQGDKRQMWDRVTGRGWVTFLNADPMQRTLLQGVHDDVIRWVDAYETN